MAVDTSRSPYFDDYNEEKNFHEILFVPARAVQTRELNQIQSIFQEQIKRFGDHVFEEGSVVIPGETNYDLELRYITVTVSNYETIANQLVPERISLSNVNGVTASVKLIRTPEGADPLTFYLQYEGSDTTEDTSLFQTGETLDIISSTDDVIGTASVTGQGTASKFTINDGVYYLNGRFVLVSRETVLLDKYSGSPSKIVTIEYDESIVTENSDTSLYDNAQGTPNFTAPGAHRLRVDTSLNVYDLSELETLPEDAVEIFRIEEGRVQKKVDKPDYAVLNDVMAQRTYEESGDYTVKAFNIGFREHSDIFTEAPDSDKFVARMESGLAYVRGYRVETLDTENVVIDKARETGIINNSSISAALGNYIEVEDLNIIPDVNTLQEITFYDASVTTPGVQPSGNALGTARVRFVRHDDPTHRLYLFDIRDSSGNRSSGFIGNAVSIHSSIGTPVSANLVEASLSDAANNSLVFPMNVEYVRSLNDESGVSDTSYSSVKQYTTTTDSNGRVTISASTNEVFVSQDPTYALATFTDTGEHIEVSGNFSLSGSPTGSVITFDFGAINDGRPVRINTQVAKQQVSQKTKLVQTGTKAGTLTAGDRLYLDQADVYEIISATDDDGNDVTSRISLSKNTTASYYGISYVTTTSTLANPITVEFRYFQHSAGDYFGPDSYVDIPYGEIPFENGVRLSDVLDFRPRMGSSQDFNSSGYVVGNIPTPYTVVRADVEHYLPRIDKIYVGTDGNFGVVQGVPALTPEKPEDPSNAMVLYTLEVPAYTFNLEDVNAEKMKNRRYTMKDIGRLEQRISDVEYYVSLNLLEQEAESKQVMDENGLNRFKNGFFTDSFIDHSIGNYVWDGYHVSMDEEAGAMRPEFSLNAFDLEMDYNQSTNVVENAGIVTLPFTHRSFIRQNTRSETMNVNPYAVFRWEGDIELRPSVDSWIDTVYADPEVTYRVFNNGRLTQSWQSWQLNWTGGSTSQSSSRTVTTPPHSEWQPGDSTEPGAWTHGRWANGGWRRSTRTFTTTTTTRTNIDVVNDRIIDTSVIPYMRSIVVNIEGVGHRPESRMHFFFDKVKVNQYVRPNGGSYGQAVRSDEDGNFNAQFKIPNNSNQRFRTGEKTLTITDASDGVRENSTSWADAIFTSTGTRRVRRQTIVATRSTTTTTRQTSVRWHDPLAQSFLVERDGGIFVTKINVFFATKDDRVPVNVEIREMENGAPTQNVVPGAKKTLNPSQVNTSSDGSQATTFEFPHPIYLTDGAEYCFVVWSNSNNYEAFIARMGQKDLGTGRYIVEQPYAGVLFKSQNNSTWTADQTADLQFEIFSAKFDTNVVGQLIATNSDFDPIQLAINPIETTSGSNIVHITRNQHNYVVGASVTITGAIGGNGITDAELNGTHEVQEIVSPNKIAIQVTNNATDTGDIGGESIEISHMVQASLLNPNIPTMEASQTRLTFQAKGTIGQSFDGTETPYQQMTGFVELSNENVNDIEQPWMITNRDDEIANLNGNKSFTLRGIFESANDNLSPVVDMDGNSVITPFVMITNDQTQELDGSNNWANYVNKFVTLTTPANSIRVYLDTYKPQGSDIIISARFGNSQEELMESDWMEVTPIVEQTSGSVDDFLENEYALDNVDDYTVYQVMIQMKSDSAVRYPICKRLRVLALGT